MSTGTAEPQVEAPEHAGVVHFHTHRATMPAALAAAGLLMVPFVITLITGTRGPLSAILLVVAIGGAALAVHVRARMSSRAQRITLTASALAVDGAGGRRSIPWGDVTAMYYSRLRLAFIIGRRGGAGSIVIDGDVPDVAGLLGGAARAIDDARRADGRVVAAAPSVLLRRPAAGDAALAALVAAGVLLGLLVAPAWFMLSAITLPVLLLHWTLAPYAVSVDDTAVWVVRPLGRDVLPLRGLRGAALGVAGRPSGLAVLLEHRERGTIALTGLGSRTIPLLDVIRAALERDRAAQRGGSASRLAGTATLRGGSRHSALLTAAILVLALSGVAWVTILTGIPVRTASRHGSEAVVRIALMLGAPRSSAGGDGRTALHIAAARNDAGIVHALIEGGAPIDAPAKGSGATPLHEAAERGHRAAMGVFIAAGADVNAGGPEGRTPLAQAALAGAPGDTAVARMLIEAGAGIDRADDRGRTPLHYAALNGHVELVRLLARSGAALESIDSLGHRPLHAAVSMRQQGTVEALLRAGADPDARGRGGRTAVAAAAADNAPLGLVGALLDGGARAHIGDDDGWNAIQLAASAGSIELLELFARRRARLDATDGRIAPALTIAAESGNIDAARALLRGGASPRLRWEGRSPLDIARAKNNGRLLALMQMR